MSHSVTRTDESGSIYFLTVYLAQQVHQVGLGFTRMTYVFAWSKSESEAQEVVTAWLAGQGIDVLRFAGTSMVAVKQDLRAYTFPEHVHGAPYDMVLDAMKAKRLPDDWHQEDVKQYRKARDFIAKGRKILQERAKRASLIKSDALCASQQ